MPKECHFGRTEAVTLEKATLRQIAGEKPKASETKRQEPVVLPARTAGVRSHTRPACRPPSGPASPRWPTALRTQPWTRSPQG